MHCDCRSAYNFGKIFFFGLFFSGCAGLFNGSTQDVSITTYPPNAKITIDSQPGNTFTTPVTVELKRKDIHRIRAVSEGFDDTVASVTPRTDGIAIAIDCLVWLCIPLIIDWPIGAIKELAPNNLTIVMPESKTAKKDPVVQESEPIYQEAKIPKLKPASISPEPDKLPGDKNECKEIAQNDEEKPFKVAYYGCMKDRGWIKN